MPGVEDDARQTVIMKRDSSDRIDRINRIDRARQILFILLSRQRGHSGPIDIGQRTLTAGDHTFTIEIVGTSDKGQKSYFVGLDVVGLDDVIPTPDE